jgi:hypothetical protein
MEKTRTGDAVAFEGAGFAPSVGRRPVHKGKPIASETPGSAV